jgi:uncharacterized protein
MANHHIVGNATLRPLVAADRVAPFMRAVYAWMAGGLALTASTAWFAAASPSFVQAIATNALLFWGLAIAQLGIVVARRPGRLRYPAAGRHGRGCAT